MKVPQEILRIKLERLPYTFRADPQYLHISHQTIEFTLGRTLQRYAHTDNVFKRMLWPETLLRATSVSFFCSVFIADDIYLWKDADFERMLANLKEVHDFDIPGKIEAFQHSLDNRVKTAAEQTYEEYQNGAGTQ